MFSGLVSWWNGTPEQKVENSVTKPAAQEKAKQEPPKQEQPKQESSAPALASQAALSPETPIDLDAEEGFVNVSLSSSPATTGVIQELLSAGITEEDKDALAALSTLFPDESDVTSLQASLNNLAVSEPKVVAEKPAVYSEKYCSGVSMLFEAAAKKSYADAVVSPAKPPRKHDPQVRRVMFVPKEERVQPDEPQTHVRSAFLESKRKRGRK